MRTERLRPLLTWLFFRWQRPDLALKTWLVFIMLGLTTISAAIAQVILFLYRWRGWPDDLFYKVTLGFVTREVRATLLFSVGIILLCIGTYKLYRALMAPSTLPKSLEAWIKLVRRHQRLERGLRLVAIGGGTGMPTTLRAMRTVTSNITAIVTVADDGGSSGRLRRELGVQPPGDLRRNIIALARDEDLMTQLFDFRFSGGELEGHSFGNLFLVAMVGLTGSMDKAAAMTGDVLAIQGRVLPCTLDDVHLVADVRHRQSGEMMRVEGESQIPGSEWRIEKVALVPQNPAALPDAVKAILEAEYIIIGPGSLYTSILPNLVIPDIANALSQSKGLKIYVCNIATQPGETDDYSVADHIEALEVHIGKKAVDVVIANNHYPLENAGPNTIYVQAAPETHAVNEDYRLIYADLTDDEHPWRHSPDKLQAIFLHL